MVTVAVGEFKAKCLGLVSDVEKKRESVLVTKYGKPVAKLVPLELADEEDPLAAFHYPGMKIVGDIEAPLYSDAEHEEFFERSAAQLR